MIVAALFLVIVAAVMVSQIQHLLPPQSVIEKEFSFSERRAYYRAVTDLDSKDPAAWERARQSFRRLSEAHPDLAWPMLYHAITLEKLGKQTDDAERLTEANRKWTQATQKPDYSEASTQRLKEDPRSVTLLIMQAVRTMANPSDHQALKKAGDILRTAIEIEPERVAALQLLAEVEQKCDQPDEAIRHFRRAIELAEAEADELRRETRRLPTEIAVSPDRQGRHSDRYRHLGD